MSAARAGPGRRAARPARPVQPTMFPALLLPESFDAAHWVRLQHGSRRPLPGIAWSAAHPTETEIRAHVAQGGAAGLVPASVHLADQPLVVFDVDSGDADALAALYEPVAFGPTARGAHLWYRDDGDGDGRSRGEFAGPGDTFGQVLSARAYAALHGPELVHLDNGIRSALSGALRAGVGIPPFHLLTRGGQPATAAAAARERAARADAAALFEAALLRAFPVDLGALVGMRHDAMLAALAKFAGCFAWTNGRGGGRTPITPEYLALRAACYWRAMPQRETFPLTEAVGILAWVLAKRVAWLANHAPDPERQAARGRAGKGRPTAGAILQSASMDASNEAAQPWTAAGVSRATWYRQRRAERAAQGAPLFAAGNSPE